jgi:hypothetical protein
MPSSMIVTPRGVIRYPSLCQPDRRFVPEGVFKTDLILDEGDAAPLQKRLQAILDAYISGEGVPLKGPKAVELVCPWSPEYEDDDETETGRVIFKFKQNAVIKTRAGDTFEKRILLFDAKTQPIETLNVGSGTEAKVRFEPYCWGPTSRKVGISLRLNAVQVLKLVEYNGGEDATGFDEEAGYEAASFDTEDY